MDVPGILTRNVDDCLTILNTIAGHDPKDSTTIDREHRRINLPAVDKMNIRNLKVGIPIEYHCKDLSEEVLETWNDVAKLLEENGAQIKKVTCYF